MNLLPLLAACLLAWLPLRLFPPASLQRVCFATLTIAFFYWYWAPAFTLLLFPADDLMQSASLTSDAIASAAWLVLVYHLAAVLALAMARNFIDAGRYDGGGHRPVATIALAVLVSTALALFMRFGNEGASTIIEILSGSVSARRFLSFYNRADDAADALLALWDVVNLGVATFLVAYHMLQARTLSAGSLYAFAAILLSFLASGSRVTLLLALVAVGLARLARGTDALDRMLQLTNRSRLRVVYAGSLVVVGGAAMMGIGARFRFGAGSQENYVADTLINNNDMFRETAFILANLGSYTPTNPVSAMGNFALTPFWYLFPSFLGFSKDIPEHLVFFDYQRAGIDLINGQGNVFPGVVGDFQLLFGNGGPLLFALFVTACFASIGWGARRIATTTPRFGFAVAMLSFVFISFRNIQGSLALLWLMLLLVAATLTLDEAGPATSPLAEEAD